MKGGVPLFLRPRGLAACDAIFFFTRAQTKRPLLRIRKRLSALYPLQGGEGGIASLDDLTKSRTTPYGIDPRCPRAFTRDGNAPFSCPMKSRHEALHAAAKRKRAAHRNPRLRRITSDATTNTESLRRGRDAGPPPHRAARSYHAKAQSIRGAIGYDMKTPRRTAMRARDLCSETAAHTQRPHATSHKKSRTASANSEGFGKVGIGQGLKTGTRRSRCDGSKASPDSALLIQHVRFLRRFPSSSRSLVICEENDNGVRAPYGLRQSGPATPTREIRYRYNIAQPVRATTSGSHIATGTLCPYQQTPVHGKCLLPRPLASRKSLTALRHVMPRGAGRCLRQSRDAIAKRDTTRRGTGAPCQQCTKRCASSRPRTENEAPVPTHVLRPRVTAHRAVPLSGLRTRIRSNATADAVHMRCGTSPGTPSPKLPPDSAQRRARRSQEG